MKNTFFQKQLLLLASAIVLGTNLAHAQEAAKVNKLINWQLADPDSGSYIGTGANAAYETLLQGKTPTPIVVAVIDGGTDEAHKDLAPILWTNTGEVASNGLDDDKNGYTDDIHGWSFLGGKNGDVNEENLELTRLYAMGKKGVPATIKWKAVRKDYKKQLKQNQKELHMLESIEKMMKDAQGSKQADAVTASDLEQVQAHGLVMKLIKKEFVNDLKNGTTFPEIISQLAEGKKEINKALNCYMNPAFNGRTAVGDNVNDMNERHYGNNNITGPAALHGTHVAGIIAAVRNNNFGMDGISSAAKIMVVRVVPDGDERDKDVANAIRYATDNGAKIINMSFGKSYSPYKSTVDDAIRYADSKGVLMIHAAGNDHQNNDVEFNFPHPRYADGTRCTNWIEVGASDSKGHAARFSNYGKLNVDLFAPGVMIYSTVPGDTCKMENGTSMASPVVAGVAALIWSYYPTLTAAQVKQAILSTVNIPSTPSFVPGNPKKVVPMSELCVTGGIVDAKKALVKAAELAR